MIPFIPKTVGLPDSLAGRSTFALCTIGAVALTIIALSKGGATTRVVAYSMIGGGGLLYVLATLTCIKKKSEEASHTRNSITSENTPNNESLKPPEIGKTINDLLPAEMRSEIFKYLPSADLLHCQDVCQLWNNAIIESPELFSKAFIKDALTVATTNRVGVYKDKSEILAKVAIAAAKIGSFAQAIDIVRTILYIGLSIKTLEKVAIIAFQMKRPKIATDIINEIVTIIEENSKKDIGYGFYGYVEANAYAVTARAAAMIGNFDLARNYINFVKKKILQPGNVINFAGTAEIKIITEIVKAAALMGDTELLRSLLVLTPSETSPNGLFAEAAKAASIKNIELARKFAHKITDPSVQSKTLAEIAKAAAQMGEVKLAFEISDKITPIKLKCEILVETAKAAAQMGETKLIKDVIDAALSYAKNNEFCQSYKSSFLAEIALTVPKKDRYLATDIIEYAKQVLPEKDCHSILPNYLDPLKACVQIAIFTAQKDVGAAKKMLREELDDILYGEAHQDFKVSALVEIAKGAHLIGDCVTAESVISKAESFARNIDLIMVARGAVQIGNIKQALYILTRYDRNLDPYAPEQVLAEAAVGALKQNNIKQFYWIIQQMEYPSYKVSAFVEGAKFWTYKNRDGTNGKKTGGG